MIGCPPTQKATQPTGRGAHAGTRTPAVLIIIKEMRCVWGWFVPHTEENRGKIALLISLLLASVKPALLAVRRRRKGCACCILDFAFQSSSGPKQNKLLQAARQGKAKKSGCVSEKSKTFLAQDCKMLFGSSDRGLFCACISPMSLSQYNEQRITIYRAILLYFCRQIVVFAVGT